MRKRLLSLSLLIIPAVSFAAQIVKPNPDPGVTGEGFVTYVGTYGEVFKLRGGWRVDPSMHGDVEVVNQYPPFKADTDSLEAFHPSTADFAPENFTRLALIQLIIMPRATAPFKSLAEVKRLKIKDLTEAKVGFTVFDHPFFGGWAGTDWPEGSFEIWVSTPYRLTQLYTATADHICILTSGRDEPPSSVISSHYDWMRMSLRDWVTPKAPDQSLSRSGYPSYFAAWSSGKSIRLIQKPVIWMSWSITTAIALLFAGIASLLGRWTRLREISVTFLILSNVGALVGATVGLLLWPFGWPVLHAPLPGALAAVFMPPAVILLGRIRHRKTSRPALAAIAAWTIIASLGLLTVALAYPWGSVFAPFLPGDTAILMFLAFGIGGMIAGALDGNTDVRAAGGTVLALTALLLLSSGAHSQGTPVIITKAVPNGIDPGIEINARARVAATLTEERIRERAVSNIQQKHPLYRFQRVEIKGIWSKDDTNDTLQKMFDHQIEPTHIGDIDPPLIHMPGWIKDLQELHRDANQEISDTAINAVKELENQEVNEIVAHSWGTEIVYNAILYGQIKPPRRLIVAGMPDRDVEKWRMLSKYTGTEVVMYTDSHDPAALGARIGGAIRDALSRSGIAQSGATEDVIVRDPALFEQKWAELCQLPRVCNGHARTPPAVEVHSTYKKATHSRLEYYKAMQADGVLPKEGDADELKAAQDDLVKTESDRILEVALDKERKFIALETERQKRDFERQRKEITQPIAPAPLPAVTQPVQLDRYWQARALQALASKACQNPGDVTRGDYTAAGVLGMGAIPGAADFAERLSGCPRFLFDRMLEANQAGAQLSDSKLNGWIQDFQRQTPPVSPPTDQRQRRREERDPERGERKDPCKRAYPGYCND